VTGVSEGQGTDWDYATIKYNSQGQELWVARYNGPGNGIDEAFAIAVDNNGNIYVTGVSEGQGAVGDYATIKYNSQGQELWVARYNGPGNFGDVARAIAVDNQGNSYVTGKSFGSSPYEDYATIKYNSEGQVVWVARYNGPGNGYDEASAIAVDNNGNVYVTGMSEGQGSSSDYATIKYPSISEVKEENKKDNTLIEGNHQNLKIFNILGQTVNSSLKDLRHGIYFIKAQEKKVKEKLSLPNKKKLYEKMLLYWRHRAKEE
jgi:predicted acetyltransferase